MRALELDMVVRRKKLAKNTSTHANMSETVLGKHAKKTVKFD